MRESLNRLKGKVAVITGSTSGIGKACAILFAKEGATVVINGRRIDKGNQVCKEIIDAGGKAIFIQADMTVDADIKNLIDQALKQFGKIDILVNNAGTDNLKPFEDLTDDDWECLIKLDARAYFKTIQEVIPTMVKQGNGAIVNVTSFAAIKARPTQAIYCFVKAGVTHMTRVIAQEYAAKGVRVNSLLPGLTYSEMLAKDPNFDRIMQDTPMGRAAQPKEIAYAALFLVSDEASYVTGAALVVDGGVCS